MSQGLEQVIWVSERGSVYQVARTEPARHSDSPKVCQKYPNFGQDRTPGPSYGIYIVIVFEPVTLKAQCLLCFDGNVDDSTWLHVN